MKGGPTNSGDPSCEGTSQRMISEISEISVSLGLDGSYSHETSPWLKMRIHDSCLPYSWAPVFWGSHFPRRFSNMKQPHP